MPQLALWEGREACSAWGWLWRAASLGGTHHLRSTATLPACCLSLQESKEAGGKRGRGRPGRRADGAARRPPAAAAASEQAGGASGSAARGCRWGEAPERVAAVGYHEDLATFHTRLR
jgi:hypothetical protein